MVKFAIRVSITTTITKMFRYGKFAKDLLVFRSYEYDETSILEKVKIVVGITLCYVPVTIFVRWVVFPPLWRGLSVIAAQMKLGTMAADLPSPKTVLVTVMVRFAIVLYISEVGKPTEFFGSGAARVLGNIMNFLFFAYYGYVLTVIATRILKRAGH